MDRASEGAGGLGQGDHACLVCETDEERWNSVEEFARDGVKRGERMLYVALDSQVALEAPGAAA